MSKNACATYFKAQKMGSRTHANDATESCWLFLQDKYAFSYTVKAKLRPLYVKREQLCS